MKKRMLVIAAAAVATSMMMASPVMADDFKGLNWDKKMEHEKSAVRCKVEHPFLIVKKQMGYSKVVYRGIAKNMHRFHMLFASANLLMCSRAGRTKDFVGCTV